MKLRRMFFLLVLLLVPALLYVPAVQDLARRRAVAYASRTLGMEVSVERIRLAFPLRLTVDNTLLADRTDTLLRCGRLSLDAALWPLIRKEVVIRSFALERVAAHYKDTLAGMDLRLAAGELSLEAVRADLSANTAGISRLVLADADIRLNLTEAAPAEKKESAAALPWTVGLDRIAVSSLAFGMRTSPAVSELSVRLADGSVDTCRVLLDSQQVSVKSVLLDRGAYSYLTGPAEAESGTSAGTTEASAPWTVRVGRVALTDNSVEYGRLGHRPAAGFDPAVIALAPLILWGAVLAVLERTLPDAWFWLIYLVQIANVSGSAGDVYCVVHLRRLPRDILIQDTGTRMRVYAPRSNEEQK